MLLLACTEEPSFELVYTNDGTTPADTADSGTPLTVLGAADVVVIGGGASGLTAAVEASATGASVIILERADILGGAGLHAGNYYGAGTRWQEQQFIADSPEIALAEWDSLTGGDASSPWVESFVYGSGETLEWLEGFGSIFSGVVDDPGAGEVSRIHQLQPGNTHPVVGMGEMMQDSAWLGTTAVALIDDGDGAVVGVVVEQADGSVGAVEAGAVVVATGGFARNDERVYAAIPALLEFPRHAESWPGMDGNGLDLIESVDGTLVNLENIALYAHGLTDANLGSPEVMILVGLTDSVVVDGAGQRVMDEDDLRAVFGGRQALVSGELLAIFDTEQWSRCALMGLGYNYDSVMKSALSGPAYADRVAVTSAPTLEELGEQFAINGAVLKDTIVTYNAAVDLGVDEAFGKDMSMMHTLRSPPFVAVSLALATGKSFGGAALATDGGVLGSSGVAIPGLYAAGEVAGVLGGSHLGHGISGSITGVIFSGRVAGAGAAAHARR